MFGCLKQVGIPDYRSLKMIKRMQIYTVVYKRLLHALNGIPSLQYEEQGYGVECAI
jgi:hypothetical protein